MLSDDSEDCIIVDNLKKHYHNNVPAVNNISFKVRHGEVFGLLGPNGAGKTTTIRILTTLIRPSAGTVKIFGRDIVRHGPDIRKRMGVVLQKPSYEPSLTVEKSLDLYGLLWGIKSDKRKERVKKLLKTFDIEEISSTKNADLSIGQRRRVQIAREFMHDIDLLYLDEPTVGLDPSAKRTLLNHIKSLVGGGLTVLFTTHIMDEAEYLCDRIAIINKGKIVATDTPLGLKQRYGGIKTIEIEVEESIVAPALYLLKTTTKIDSVQSQAGNIITMNTLKVHQDMTRIIKLFEAHNLEIKSMNISSPSLEDVFLNLVDANKTFTSIQTKS